jgi:iron complex outermembrane receptor protein
MLIRSVAVLAVSLLVAAFSPVAFASQEAGSIVGVVSDEQGAVLPGAAVTLVDAGGNAVRTVFTDASGRYRFTGLAPQRFSVRVEMSGFRPVVRDQLQVTATPVTVDVTLALGSLLETVVVTGTRAEQQLGKIPAAMTVIDTQEVLRGQQMTNVNDVLKRVPGVAIRVHLDGSTRAVPSVRGAGAQNTFGSRGVRILVDGIPKNNAGGSAQDFINVDLASLQRVEVVRGPASALYGNQAGGVINFITEEGAPVPFVQYQQTVGSFGLTKEHFKLSGQKGNLSYFGSASRTDQTGYRQLSDYSTSAFQSKLRYTTDSGASLTTIVSFQKLTSVLPGSLTAEEVAANPRQPNPALAATGGSVGSIDEFRTGIIYSRPLFGQDQIEFTGYYVPRPIYISASGPIRNAQFFINRGANVRYMNARQLFGAENRLTVGVDYQNTPLKNEILNRVTGAAQQLLEENLQTVGMYVQNELSLGKVLFNVGGRFDTIKFGFEDLMRAGQPGSSFTRKFERFTPKLGVVFRALPSLSLYGNYSEGLEAPVSEQLRNSPFTAGEFVLNVGLDPMIYQSFELGAKGQAGSRLSFEFAAFRQDIDNFIVTRQILRPAAATTFTASLNAAKVRQNGIEFGSTVKMTSALSANVSYTFSDYSFSQFDALGQNLTGNRLAGIPRHDVFADIRYHPASGFNASIDLKSVARYFVDDVNLFTNNPYKVVTMSVGYDRRVGGRALWSPFLTINNLFNEQYTSLPQVNDGARRFFNPMPGRSALGGVTIKY